MPKMPVRIFDPEPDQRPNAWTPSDKNVKIVKKKISEVMGPYRTNAYVECSPTAEDLIERLEQTNLNSWVNDHEYIYLVTGTGNYIVKTNGRDLYCKWKGRPGGNWMLINYVEAKDYMVKMKCERILIDLYTKVMDLNEKETIKEVFLAITDL